jgi:penicillin G amidase
VRKVTLRHFLGELPVFKNVFNLGPVPWPGDVTTVSQGAVDYLDPMGNPLGVVAMRMMLDVGNWENNRWVLAGGESGNPASPHYSDLFDLWKEGRGVTMAWSREAVGRAAKSTLRLTPEVNAREVESEPSPRRRNEDVRAPEA